MTKLEQIRNELDNYIQEELKKSPPDRDWEVWSFEDAKESLIEKGMHLIFSNEEIEECASKIAKSKFEELPEPGDYDD